MVYILFQFLILIFFNIDTSVIIYAIDLKLPMHLPDALNKGEGISDFSFRL